MFKNYLIVALRHFWKNKLFSLINVFGLSVGISSALVIFLIVYYNFSFDVFEKENDRIYRVVTESRFADNTNYFTSVSPKMEETIKNISGIGETIAFKQVYSEVKVTVPKNQSNESAVFKHQSDVIFADRNYFKLINYQWIAGSPYTSLSEPFKVVLSEERARLYFPGIEIPAIIGKQIAYNDSTFVTVSGVVKELGIPTNFTFKEFISIQGIKAIDKGFPNFSELWLKLSPHIYAKDIERQLNLKMINLSQGANKANANTIVYRLQPLSNLHFNPDYYAYGVPPADKKILYGLLIIAFFLLLLGCINYINLSTAQAVQRAKEIGIRKTVGSSVSQLIAQFLTEAFFITLVSAIISVLMVPALLRLFEDFIPNNLHFDWLLRLPMLLFLVALIVMISFLSGFYPAIVLSRYNPVVALRNQGYSGTSVTRKSLLRKVLTVSQFFVAQVFIMATLITGEQIHYMLSTDLGYKKDAIILFGVPMDQNGKSLETDRKSEMLHSLQSIPEIEMISLDNGAPAEHGYSSLMMKYKDRKREIETDVELKIGDSNYLSLYHIKLLAGRMVKQSDTPTEYLINETYLHILGFKQPSDALHKLINNRPIVGVISDFHDASFYYPIKPLVFSSDNNCSQFSVALKPQGKKELLWPAVINKIEKYYKNIYPDEEFDFNFFDASIAQFYESEQHILKLLKWATILALVISSLGLLGLVIYSTNVRTKEIGIRKIMGASVKQIVFLLSNDFIKLVFLAFLFATPLGWWIMHKWLQHFVYRITISWWLFSASGAIMLTLSLITISIRVLKTANGNPIKSLRSE